MKIEKSMFHPEQILFKKHNDDVHRVVIHFETESHRDIVFKHWEKAIKEIEESKCILRPVYIDRKTGSPNILSLRYSSIEAIKETDKLITAKTHDLIAVYNELEKTFINVN